MSIVSINVNSIHKLLSIWILNINEKILLEYSIWAGNKLLPIGMIFLWNVLFVRLYIKIGWIDCNQDYTLLFIFIFLVYLYKQNIINTLLTWLGLNLSQRLHLSLFVGTLQAWNSLNTKKGGGGQRYDPALPLNMF